MKKIAVFAFLYFFIPFFAFCADEGEELAEELSPEIVQALEAPSQLPENTLIAAVDPVPADFTPERNFGPPDDNFVDPRVLRDFVESRGLIECRQKCGKLIIAGDVRAKWTATGERVDGIKKRGFLENKPINKYKSELNLFLDYETKCSWVSTKLKWATIDGLVGSKLDTELDRAFIGYDIYEKGDEDFYIEIGRSRLEYIYDSRVQFSNVFDGIHFYYTNKFDCLGTFVIHGGPFIVDAASNHYAWIVETYISKWAGTGFTFKYSLIDWRREGGTILATRIDSKLIPFTTGYIHNNPRYRFLISQAQLGYEKKIDFMGCKSLYMYGAVLANHDARKSRRFDKKPLNHAWYVGFTLGKLCKACDWSLDVNYQNVQAFAVPEFDVAGIGTGNADGTYIYDAIIASRIGLFRDGNGFTNYKGWQISLLYAMTDTLSLRTKAEWSTPRNGIGKPFLYKNFEMAVIYAF